MATHGFSFNTDVEALYQAYLTAVGQTDAEAMAALKDLFILQVQLSIETKGEEKFNNLSLANKIAFLAS